MNTMELADFCAFHEPALTLDEIQHGLILNALARTSAGGGALSCWTLGAPGQCAIKMQPHSIVLGALDQDQCHRLAGLTAQTDYPGVVGPEDTAIWFAARAATRPAFS